MLLQGTRSHIIRPRTAKTLSFLLRSHEVFVGPLVHHPGFPPKIDARRLEASINTEMVSLKNTIARVLISGKA
jgi:hypothetical protein